MPQPAARLAAYYDRRLAEHGDTPRGAAWPNARDRITRFDVMLDLAQSIAPNREIVLCDLGCGTGELLARIRERELSGIRYVGADISAAAITSARRKFPDAAFHRIDVLAAADAELEALRCDVAIANGLFTVKHDLTHAEMWDFMTATVARMWPLARRGVAFNVMSAIVDHERDDLFHVPFDEMARFLHGIAGRSIGFRADYGLYEYTAYAAKEPARAARSYAPAVTHAVHGAEQPIPVFRALLPTAAALQPYLATLDRTRSYSNHGALVRRFESRIAEMLSLAPEHVASASSGTAALAGAILGSAGRATSARPYCIAPAYTFVGTASAIEQCGYRVHLCDVDAETWSLDPDLIERHPMLDRTGVVVVVAPYGRIPDLVRWAAFARRTGIPVVIDAAAGFEALVEQRIAAAAGIPIALSFHATKSFSTGEGGAVLCADAGRTAAIAGALNFGFHDERLSRGPSINGKMSEYHAAVGLAELDGWDRKRAAFAAVHDAYAREAAACDPPLRIVTAPSIASCYVLIEAQTPDAAELVRGALDAVRAQHREWYGLGLHHEPAFAAASRDALGVTDGLAPRLIGLPVAADLSGKTIRRIAGAIAGATNRARSVSPPPDPEAPPRSGSRTTSCVRDAPC